MLGAVIMAHGDDRGLVLPPALAPHQVVIVPIGRGDERAAVDEAAAGLAADLEGRGVRAHVDGRDASPGFKFNDWELRGVPLRVELGPRDLAAGQAVVVARIGTEGKQAVGLDGLAASVPDRLAAFQQALLERATAFRDEHTAAADDWDALTGQVSEGFATALHCGRTECEDDIKAETAASPRCVPTGGAPEEGSCVRCGQPSAYGTRVVFARAY